MVDKRFKKRIKEIGVLRLILRCIKGMFLGVSPSNILLNIETNTRVCTTTWVGFVNIDKDGKTSLVKKNTLLYTKLNGFATYIARVKK